MSKNLKYYQQILAKVSFDVKLFRKELKKAYGYLNPKVQTEENVFASHTHTKRKCRTYQYAAYKGTVL